MLRTRVCLLCWRPRVDWSQYFCRVKEATWRTKIGQMTKAAHAVTGGTTTLAAADKVEAGRRVPMIGIGISVMIAGTIVPMVIGIGTSVMIAGTIVPMVIGIVIEISVMIVGITVGSVMIVGITVGSVTTAGTIVPMVTGIVIEISGMIAGITVGSGMIGVITVPMVIVIGISGMIGVITVLMVIVIGISGMIAGTIVGSGMIAGITVRMVIVIGTATSGTTVVVGMIAGMTVAIIERVIVGIGATSSHGLPGSAQTGVAKIAAMTDSAARSRSHTRLNTVQQTPTSP